jgi:hypothetical protein
MAFYLTWQIEIKALNYKEVFEKKFFQKWKDDVDTMLTADGYTIGDDGYAVKTSTAETTTA